MKEQFATYEIALKLKELGFNEECFGFYKLTLGDNIPELHIVKCNYNSGKYITITEDFYTDAPLWQQIVGFLRNKYNFHIYVSMTDKTWCNIINKHIEEAPQLGRTINDFKYSFNIIDNNDDAYFGHYPNYEESLEKAILKSIELIKINNHK